MNEKKKGIIAEFKEFIARGNVVDMAVGVIIGGAFKAIVDSLIADIINPILGVFTGGSGALAGLALHLPGGGDIMLGNFINAIINFLLMALVIFCMVKAINSFHRKREEPAPAPEPEPQPDPQLVLLEEIRDLLKEKQNG